MLVEKVGDCLQHRLKAYALAEEFEIGKTDLGDRGSCHFLTFLFLMVLSCFKALAYRSAVW